MEEKKGRRAAKMPRSSGTTAPHAAVLPPLQCRVRATPKRERAVYAKSRYCHRHGTTIGTVLLLSGARYYRPRGTTAPEDRYYRYCGMCSTTSPPVLFPNVPLHGLDYK